MASPVCLITGVGPGNGAAFARTLAGAGYRVAMLARSAERLRELEAQIPGTAGYAVDVTSRSAVPEACARIAADLGDIQVLIHNAGSGVFSDFMHTSPEAFEDSWRTNALALLLCGQEVVPGMLRCGGGAIVVIGATASVRGGTNFAAFAAAKAAQRSLAQSMARSLWPQGIHVAYVVIDGVIDTPRARAFMADAPDTFFLKPAAIADSVLHLVQQDRSAWTFELDVRPFAEKW